MMEQQKEKKNYGRRKRRRQSSSMSQSNLSLPIDLVSEILSKLPAKSIMRSRCVSKLWSSITTDPYFIKTRYLPKPILLMFFRYLDKLFVFSFPHHHQNSNEPHHFYSSQPLDRYQIKFPKNLASSCVESVHGLICFNNCGPSDQTPVIWNPAMRQFLTLPKPEKSWRKRTTLFLGYDPIEGKHKVVCMPCDEFCDECWVLTLVSSSVQESSWRKIKTNLNHRPIPDICRKDLCVNGVLYYKAFDHMRQRVIMSFDVRSEKFQLTLPIGTNWGLLLAYEGRFAFATYGEGIIKFCVLEDAEKQVWSHKSFGAPLVHHDSSLDMSFQLRGVTDGGEFIYTPYTSLKSFCILYFDPKRDSFRKVVFDGIADRRFRLSNGLGNVEVHAFPNHIESLISF